MTNPTYEDMQIALDRQRKAFLTEGVVGAEIRIDRIDRAINILEKHGSRFGDAMAADFGHRSRDLSKQTDINGSIEPLKYAKKHLRNWMKPERRKVMFPLGLLGARARLEFQPLGVVGCISPWNFPVQLTFGPLAGILAAGNRAMIKPSEFTVETSELMKNVFAEEFDEEEVAMFTGGPEVGSAFSRLPFDHLIFTGAMSVAKHVMKAAAENLVPVTLELGGKSPVIIGRSADLKLAANNIMAGKTMNAGQICLSPDYVYLPEESRDEFVEHARSCIARMFPTIKDNPDYTSIVNAHHFERLQGYLEDASAKGAKLVELNPAAEDFSQQEHRRIPPTLALDTSEDMQLMQDEIFGPILPVRQYNELSEALDHVNSKDRPLGLYYFGADKAEETRVLTQTTSGGVTINDVIMHVGQEDLPFGGVGPSGMGSYHGHDGFKNFSHSKSIFTTSKVISKLAATMRPPYKKAS
jgi:coniferyl-aldehyde dehydrogenase